MATVRQVELHYITIQYNCVWYCPVSKLKMCTHYRTTGHPSVVLRSCVWRTCSRPWHSNSFIEGSNPYCPCYRLSNLTYQPLCLIFTYILNQVQLNTERCPCLAQLCKQRFCVILKRSYVIGCRHVRTNYIWIFQAIHVFLGAMSSLYTAPRLKDPAWLSMMTYKTRRMPLSTQFLKDFMMLVKDCHTKNTKL